MATLHKEPVAGIPIICSTIPKPDDVLVGYRVIEPPKSYLCDPKPGKINVRGWASIAVLAFICWPVSCIPCFTSCSYSPYQEAVFESPKRD